MPVEMVNSEIFDFMVRNQVATGRYANNVTRDILGLLAKADKEVLQKITETNGDFSKRRLQALLKEIKSIYSETYGNTGQELKQQMLDFAPVQAAALETVIASTLPIEFNFVATSAEQLQAIISTTPITVGPDKKLLLEEIFSSLAAGKEEAIRGAVRLGMVEGETVDQVARRLTGTKANSYKDGILEIHRKHATQITHTIIQDTNNRAVEAVFDNNSDVVKGWFYVGTLDGRMCQRCAVNYGKRFDLGKGPRPPLHISCRCFQAPELKTWKEIGFDIPEPAIGTKASKGGQVRADMTYNDWLHTQDKKTQIEVLGTTRQKLFEQGRMKFEKMVNNRGEYITLDQLKKHNESIFNKINI